MKEDIIMTTPIQTHDFKHTIQGNVYSLLM